MTQIGILLILLGAGSFVLHEFDMEFQLLMWVDNWGLETGNMIRIGAVVVGVILAGIGLASSKSEPAE